MSRVAKIDENIYCPICGKHEHQVKLGKNKSGSQKYYCNDCKRYYTPVPKQHEYPEETRELAIEMLFSGSSGRQVNHTLGFNKANVYNWIKNEIINQQSAEKPLEDFWDF